MRPLTESVPKVLLAVAGHPFLHYQLEWLRNQGIGRVVLCVGFLGEAVRDRFGSGKGYGIDIQYSFDGPNLLGTAGAIRKAIPLLGQEFFVLYGDSYLEIDYSDVFRAFRQSGKAGLMTVFPNSDQWDTSNVWYEAGEIVRYDKCNRVPAMRYIDYGLSIHKAESFTEYGPDKAVDLTDVFQQLILRRELAGFVAQRRFYEIGSLPGLKELDQYLSAQANPQVI